MAFCLPPGLHQPFTLPAWSLKIFEQQPLHNMQLVPSFVLDAVEGIREGGVFSVPKEWTTRHAL